MNDMQRTENSGKASESRIDKVFRWRVPRARNSEISNLGLVKNTSLSIKFSKVHVAPSSRTLEMGLTFFNQFFFFFLQP